MYKYLMRKIASFLDELEKLSGVYGNPWGAAYNKAINETRDEEKSMLNYIPILRGIRKRKLQNKRRDLAEKYHPDMKESWRRHKELLKMEKMPKPKNKEEEKEIYQAARVKLRKELISKGIKGKDMLPHLNALKKKYNQ